MVEVVATTEASSSVENKTNDEESSNGHAMMVVSSNASSRIESLKSRGNAALAAGNPAQAAALYTSAIEVDAASPVLPVLYSNRAMAHIKAESYGLAIADAEQAIKMDPTYIKAYYRRGSANFALGKYRLALRDFKSVCKLRPTDRDARAKLRECEKAAKQLAFANAILSGDSEQALRGSDVDAIVVEDSYDGPRLENRFDDDDLVQATMERFRAQKLIHRKYVLQILLKTRDALKGEPSLVDLSLPASSKRYTICGDVHGQYYDLLKIFDLNGLPTPDNPYVFNGDFVDRGSFSFEVVLTLFLCKLRHPTGVHLNRGNHETKNMTKIYGFEGEIRHKFDSTVLGLFHECFRLLPLAACLESRVFVVHGGLSSDDDVTLDDIRAIDRECEPPDSGLMCDLLWSDPQPAPGRAPSKRGVGLSFGPDVTKRFLDRNDLSLVIRSHEVRDNGYELEHGGQLITVFSAPNYCLARDAQILTNRGFLFLDDFVDAFCRFPEREALLVAGYDPESDELVWERPLSLIVNRSEPQTLLELNSDDLSLLVTPEHQMYVQRRYGEEEATTTSRTEDDTNKRIKLDVPYAKCRADELLSTESSSFNDRDRPRLRALARAGVRAAKSNERQNFVDELGLDTDDKMIAFLEIYGYCVGGLDDASKHPVGPGGDAYLDDRFRVVGFEAEAFVRRFREESKGKKARFFDWVWLLNRDRARAVLRGLAAADEASAAANTLRVDTSSIIFRDELTRLALCAGYSSRFFAAYEDGVVKHWCVVSTTVAGVAEPIVDNVKPVAYTGRTWCVSMPSTFIWARRARKHPTEDVVAEASRPVIVGNCDAMGNKGAFVHLDQNLTPTFTTFDAAPHPPLRPMAYASSTFGL
ncbi:hypothetical protein CTAYLR_002573 [Chrysophaeum taylorii]|uniref:Serine/threonine-protein phosphatase n=1 Tax=Chrysophaeum taylorii TaxID=2483200 RepID=A0AAD7UEZ6_9STRA|nr:hypothetical protein CTAYLR_002573 [Chrysophaeum taylorii]